MQLKLSDFLWWQVLRSFRLPVSYKKTHVGKGDGLSQFASSMFIVANLVSFSLLFLSFILSLEVTEFNDFVCISLYYFLSFSV